MDALAFLSIDAVKLWMQAQGPWGGALISFALLFACGLGLPLPEDIPLIVSGALLCHDMRSWIIVSVLNWCGIIGGDVCLYFLARRYGMNITRIPLIGKHISLDRVDKVRGMFDRYGVGVVAVGRLFAGIRGVMVMTAGTIRFNFWKFLIADGLAAIVSGGLFMLLGHLLGENLNDEVIKRFKHWFALGAVVLAVGLVLYIIWRRRGHPPVVEAVAERVEARIERKTESKSDPI
jgi:membrane protein DedA with SNARE-associated domain